MKRTVIFLSIIAGVIIIMFSCSKENQTSNIDKECASCEEGKVLAQKINQFKEQLQIAKQNPKNGETITMAEAIENMELLINASHGFPFEDYNERKTDVVSFQLPVDAEGNVSMTDVNAAYDEMINLVRDAYLNTGFEIKGLILVSLSFDEENKDGENVNAKVTTGKSGEQDRPEPFEDCWYYGEDLGMCEGTTYLGIMDGGDTIAGTIAANNPIYSLYDCPGPNYHVVLDPQPEITLEGDEPGYQNNNGDNLIFFYPDDGSGFTNEEKKLYADDMNYYYNNEYEVIYNLVPHNEDYPFPDYVLVTCIINGEQFYDPNNGNIITMHHQNKLTYALRYWVQDEIIPKPTPIDL